MKHHKSTSGFSGHVLCRQLAMPIFKIVLIFLGSLFQCCLAYNVDTESAMVHSGEVGSMFGFSVAQHIDQSTNWLLVGAPKAQTSQPGVDRGGAVYRCRTDRKNYCQEIPFDLKGNNLRWNGTNYVDTEDKSNQWLGATVKSSIENGVIVACAPRYTYFSSTFDKREPVGTCFVKGASSTTTTEFSPCRTGAWGYHRQGFCQAGFSASLAQEGRKLMIAAVGSWYWQGQLYSYEVKDKNYAATKEGPAADDDSYMGYSSAVGEFNGDSSEDYVVGIPKGAQHLGKIAFFTQNLSNIVNITGEQIGAYFGFSIAVTDVDGDHRDDVIVGAPLYSSYKSSSSYDTGRVYIYYQTDQNKFRSNKKDILDGINSRSRFGTSVMGLGDINKDGYNDVAVGAPYAGEDAKGAVYIYHGSKKGIITNPSQIIYAKDLDPQLETFGYSIAGGWDQDGNTYPDLLVGAFESDKAVFLRTRPVVRVVASLKIEPAMVDLDHKSCSLVDDTKVPCLTVFTCMEYKGQGVPEELFFDVEWELDTLQRNQTFQEQRAFYMTTETQINETNTVKLTRKATWCKSSYAYVRTKLRDKLTPIAVDFKFKLHETTKRRRRELQPILSQYIPTSVRTEAQILKHCGRDNICIPNLVVNSFRVSAAHIVGSITELEVLIMIENRAEDAYNTQLYINLPPGVSYRKVHGIQSVAPVTCQKHIFHDEELVICDLGNPLLMRAKTNLTLQVSPKDVNGSNDNLIFALQVNSSNPENLSDTENNFASVSIPVTASLDIQIYGKSEPEQININTTRARLNKNLHHTRTIDHVYELRNQGPSATETTELYIYWPSHDNDAEPILPLVGEPNIMKGVGQCKTMFITPSNSSILEYSPSNTGGVNVVLQEQKNKRHVERAAGSKLACSDWCTVIRCLVGHLDSDENFLINIKAKFDTDVFLRKNANQAQLTSQAFARVLSVPYKLKSVDVSLFAEARKEVTTYVNVDKVSAGSRPIEIWIIAVSVSAGLLVLLLIIILLWWCGFFKRRKPEDEGYVAANGTKHMDTEDKTWE